MSGKYNRIIYDAVTEVSIDKTHYNTKFCYYNGFIADRDLL